MKFIDLLNLYFKLTQNGIEILLQAERTPLSLECYRERMKLFRLLRFGDHLRHFSSPVVGLTETVKLIFSNYNFLFFTIIIILLFLFFIIIIFYHFFVYS